MTNPADEEPDGKVSGWMLIKGIILVVGDIVLLVMVFIAFLQTIGMVMYGFSNDSALHLVIGFGLMIMLIAATRLYNRRFQYSVIEED